MCVSVNAACVCVHICMYTYVYEQRLHTHLSGKLPLQEQYNTKEPYDFTTHCVKQSTMTA